MLFHSRQRRPFKRPMAGNGNYGVTNGTEQKSRGPMEYYDAAALVRVAELPEKVRKSTRRLCQAVACR
jgi:hypothetical protein